MSGNPADNGNGRAADAAAAPPSATAASANASTPKPFANKPSFSLPARASSASRTGSSIFGSRIGSMLGMSIDDPAQKYSPNKVNKIRARQTRQRHRDSIAEPGLQLQHDIAMSSRISPETPTRRLGRNSQRRGGRNTQTREALRRSSTSLGPIRPSYTYAELSQRIMENAADHDVHDLYTRFDANANGFLERSEVRNILCEVLGFEPTLAETNAFFEIMDSSGDGSVDFGEFESFFHAGKGFDMVRLHHDNTITCVALSPDGKVVASGDMSGWARVHDCSTSTELFRHKMPKGVSAVALGAAVVGIGCFGGAVKWMAIDGSAGGPKDGGKGEAPSPAVRLEFSMTSDVNCMALARCGDEFAVGDKKGFVHIGSILTGETLHVLNSAGAVWGVSLAHRLMASGTVVGSTQEVAEVPVTQLRKPANRRPSNEPAGMHNSGPHITDNNLAVAPPDVLTNEARLNEHIVGKSVDVLLEGTIIAVKRDLGADSQYELALDHSDASVWVPASGVEAEGTNKIVGLPRARRKPGQQITVRVAMRVTSTNSLKYIAFGGDAEVGLWQYAGAPAAPVFCADKERRKSAFAGTARRASAIVSNLPTNEPELVWSTNVTHVMHGVSISQDATRVAFGGVGRKLHVYDTERDTEIFSWSATDTIFGVALTDDGSRVAAAGPPALRIFDVDTAAETFAKPVDDRLRGVAIAADGSVVAFGGFDKMCHVCNVNAGAKLYSGHEDAEVHSVGIDAEGLLLAVGTAKGSVIAYNTLGEWPYQERWRKEHNKTVYVVAVSSDGAWVAAGDYGNRVVVYAGDSGETVWEKTSWTGKGAPFTWGLAFSGDTTTLGIGHWDAYAYVVDTATWKTRCEVKRGDRVYSVALDRTGDRIAIGSRDKTCAVYDVGKDPDGGACEPQELYAVARTAFVYAVALTADGSLVAVGGVDKVVTVGDVGAKTELYKLVLGRTVMSLTFSPDGGYLGVGGEAGVVEVWALPTEDNGDLARSLVLPRDATINSIAFSNKSLVFSSGRHISLYGKGNSYYEWTDHPDFRVVCDVLDHKLALGTMLRKNPQLINAVNPQNNESLLQIVVRKKPAHVLDTLLSETSPLAVREASTTHELREAPLIGFLQDTKGTTAMDAALRRRLKHLVRKLLFCCIDGRMGSQPSAMAPITKSFPELSRAFPDLFLEFIGHVQLEQTSPPELVAQQNMIWLHGTESNIVRGAREASYEGMWDDLLDEEDENGEGIAETGHKTEVESLRLRIENFTGIPSVSNGGSFNYDRDIKTTVLCLASNAGTQQGDYSAFATPAMRMMMSYKWDRYAARIFHAHFAVFAIYLVVSSVFSYTAMQCADLGWDELLSSQPGRTAVFSAPLATLGSLVFLLIETLEVRKFGLMTYISSYWNWLDAFAFTLQLVSDVLFFLRHEDALSVAAVAILLLFLKVMYFARGLQRFGPLIIMIIAITEYIWPLVSFLLLLLGGFSMAFTIALGQKFSRFRQPHLTLYHLVNTGLYGELEAMLDDLRGNALAVVLFEVLMSIVMILLLNLLIAMMNAAFEKVRRVAQLEALHERAKIIIEIEMLWLPWIETFTGRDMVDRNFPAWLHILVPAKDVSDLHQYIHTGTSTEATLTDTERREKDISTIVAAAAKNENDIAKLKKSMQREMGLITAQLDRMLRRKDTGEAGVLRRPTVLGPIRSG